MSSKVDITNKRFDRLIAIKDVGSNKHKRRLWLCECDCGNTTILTSNVLRRGNTKSCGQCKRPTTRKNRHKSHCLRGHSLSGDNLYISPKGMWQCRECKRIQSKNNPLPQENRSKAHKKWIEKVPTRAREIHLKSSYKMSLEDYERMFQEQGGVCKICKEPPKEGHLLHVDHDHRCCNQPRSCGKWVRGLLCFNCNHGVGNFRDTAELARLAAAYIDSYPLEPHAKFR